MVRQNTLRWIPRVITLLITVFMVQPAHADPTTLTIAAANSLKDALRAIIPIFEKEHPNVDVRIVWGPSQTLRDQIAQGAPVDLFLPSSLEEIDHLEKRGLTLPGTKAVYAETALVLITQAALPATVSSLQDLSHPSVRRIAIGDPKTSSVGKFATEALKNIRPAQPLRSRFVYGEHSGAVLDLVASGEAEVGLVYRTDAIRNSKVQILAEVPGEIHAPIVYGLATVWTSRHPFLAKDFREFITSAAIQDVLRTYGFGAASHDARAAYR